MDYKSNLLRSTLSTCAALTVLTMAGAAQADSNSLSCPVTHDQLKTALVSADTADTTGFNNHFWAVVVNRGGVICAVAFSGAKVGSQWPASRQIAAAKAFTANGLSLNIPAPGPGNGTGALSTAFFYKTVQPSNANVFNPLFGLESGNVIDSTIAYRGDFGSFGTENDPLIGQRIGGTITFGGGLGLYKGTTIVGGIGVSGDTACADHSVAWRTRIILPLQQPSPADQLTFPLPTDPAQTTGHPHCPNDGGTQGSITPP